MAKKKKHKRFGRFIESVGKGTTFRIIKKGEKSATSNS